MAATTELQAIVRFQFRDGDVGEFKRLSAECMEIVRTKDTGTLQYDTYFNADETECVVIERFRDSDALIEHSENLAHGRHPGGRGSPRAGGGQAVAGRHRGARTTWTWTPQYVTKTLPT
jgi:quinol monooxygenase YgiN